MSARAMRLIAVAAACLTIAGIGTVLIFDPISIRSRSPRHLPPLTTSIVDLGLEEIDPDVLRVVQVHEQAVRNDLSSASVRAELAMVYHAHSLFEPAAAAYQQAIALESQPQQRAKFWFLLGLVQWEQGTPEPAIHSMKQSIENDGSNAPSHWQMGLWLMELARLDEAEHAFRNALEADPRAEAATVGLARVASQRGDDAAAASMLEQLLANAARSGTPLQNESYVRQLHARSLRNLGRADEAMSDLLAARSLSVIWPHAWLEPVLAKRTGYRAMMEKASGLIAAQRHAEAIAVVEDILRTRPDDVTALNYLGMAQLGNNDPNKALTSLQRAVAADPESCLTHISLSQVFERVDLKQSIHHAERAVALNPNSGAVHRQHGRALALNNRTGDAAEALRNAVRLGVFDWETRLLLGRMMMESGQPQDAERVLRQALAEAPRVSSIHLALARCFAEQGRFDEATLALAEGRRLDPNDPALPFVIERIRVLQQQGNASPREIPARSNQ